MLEGTIQYMVAGVFLLGTGSYVASGFIARRWFAEKERHIQRVIKSAREQGGDDIE